MERKFTHHTLGLRYSVHFGWPPGAEMPWGKYRLYHTGHSRKMVERYVWADNIGKKGKARKPGIKCPEWVEVNPENLCEVVFSTDGSFYPLNFLVVLPYDAKDDLCIALDRYGNVLTLYLRDVSRRGQAPAGDSYVRIDGSTPAAKKEELNGK